MTLTRYFGPGPRIRHWPTTACVAIRGEGGPGASECIDHGGRIGPQHACYTLENALDACSTGTWKELTPEEVRWRPSWEQDGGWVALVEEEEAQP